ncbi:MAG: gluconate 2-dehydrogenase subunit 3 family protein [Acidobacteriaceae bacterium]|nr:gluconate 2-dehydrogenase subunit 3 family protein [Acidobacteriaceae bacterium]
MSTNNDKSTVSRRDVFQILGAAPIAAAATSAALAQDKTREHAPAEAKATGNQPFVRKTFDDRQWKTICVLSDLIIPADERSGSATQAGVPEFIDDWIAFRTEQDGYDRLRAEIFGGLMWLDRESDRLFSTGFASATADQQKQILDRIAWPARASKEDEQWAAFFGTLRELVVSGFFSSKVGVADLPYLGNTIVTEWKGCDDEVWGVVEQRMKSGYEGLVQRTQRA